MSPDISSIHFFNEKMNKPEERIASILNELHKNKIKVSINVKQLLTK